MQYYKFIQGLRYDRKLLEAAHAARDVRPDGKLTLEDVRQLWTFVSDGRGMTKIEYRTLQYLLDEMAWTEEARQWMEQQISGGALHWEAQLHQVMEHMDLKVAHLDFPEAEALNQARLFPGPVSPLEAFRLSLSTFLEEVEAPQAPLQNIMYIFELFPDNFATEAEWKAALQQELRDYLAFDGMMGWVPHVPNADEDLDEWPSDFYPPTDGERLDNHWLVGLLIPSLSDHGYWAVIDRQGVKAPYCYGYN